MIEQYKIIKGLPENVEAEVNTLLQDGWTINGDLHTMKVDQYTIFVQGLVKHAQDVMLVEGEHQ